MFEIATIRYIIESIIKAPYRTTLDSMMDDAAVERPCSRDDPVNNMIYDNSRKGFSNHCYR